MSIEIKMNSLAACPDRVLEAGKTYPVPDEVAHELVAAGAASYVKAEDAPKKEEAAPVSPKKEKAAANQIGVETR